MTISVLEICREISINADVHKDDQAFDQRAKRQGRSTQYLQYIWRDNVLGMYSPNISPRTHGRLVGRDSYFGVKVNFRDLLTSRQWNSGSRLCDIYTREVSRAISRVVSCPSGCVCNSYFGRDSYSGRDSRRLPYCLR